MSLSNRGYSIIKDEYSSAEINKIRKELTVKPFVNKNYSGNNNPFPIYCESNRKIYMPRYYGIKYFGNPINFKINNGDLINVEFSKKLRDIQLPVVTAFLDSLNKTYGGGGIISIPCGYGKTVISLYILSQLKVKTLIIVHKEFLMNQWRDRINEFIPNAKIGKLQGNIIKINNTDIVLGMLQSVSMKDYPDGTFDSFGLVIFDECHHLGAEVFSKALLKASCKYTLGLSATPKRDDGLSKVFEWYLGNIVYQIKNRDFEDVHVRIIEYYSDDELYNKEELNFKGLLNSAKMINNICAYEPRTKLILDEVKLLVNENRKILILSNRVQHLKDLNAMILENTLSSTGFYLGGMKEKELEESIKNDVILATFSMAEEGFDCKELDSVILASPKSKIEQAVGRILRKKAADRDKIPMIIDICDEFSVFKSQNSKRLKFYKKNKYRTSIINMNPNKVTEYNNNELPTDLEFLE